MELLKYEILWEFLYKFLTYCFTSLLAYVRFSWYVIIESFDKLVSYYDWKKMWNSIVMLQMYNLYLPKQNIL